ncbi:uncharacterized protein [Apostichopus japonicus]|uniref:uncharacterized protein isoform X2 n=1 Tax=Stichopus japonicus TaxID=307972 RepID=UPI003AB2E422
MIRILTNMLAQMQELRKPSTDEGSINQIVENPPNTATAHEAGMATLIKRCNHQVPAKMVKDMLTGLYSTGYMARHTLTGIRTCDRRVPKNNTIGCKSHDATEAGERSQNCEEECSRAVV